MHQMIFVNLPVADLERSRTFFTSMGYTFDDRFCDGNALSLVLGESIIAMLLQRDFYQTFVPEKQVADAKTTSGALLALSADSRDEVDELKDKAVAAGATLGRTEDHGFMYGCSFDDLDGHTWEIMWMDQAAVEVGPEEFVKQQQG
ncbi:VOC family protein [Gordonia zhaorongruii]|uniref:VOC family protein n=1 Tax=Gordonia zhaorongruii TaxID=2597659 RepID=UPI0010467991|nr:VOC family protein [Gordonia zhaorongruii]